MEVSRQRVDLLRAGVASMKFSASAKAAAAAGIEIMNWRRVVISLNS
jgi:hypothetical protein